MIADATTPKKCEYVFIGLSGPMPRRDLWTNRASDDPEDMWHIILTPFGATYVTFLAFVAKPEVQRVLTAEFRERGDPDGHSTPVEPLPMHVARRVAYRWFLDDEARQAQFEQDLPMVVSALEMVGWSHDP